MTRLSLEKINGIPQFTPSDKGSGAAGQIRFATMLGREIRITLPTGESAILNRGSLIDFLNAQVEKSPSLKGRQLEKGWFFGYGNSCDDDDITTLFKDVLDILPDKMTILPNQQAQNLPDQTTPLANQQPQTVSDIKAKHAQRKANLAADKVLWQKRLYFPINTELDMCRNFESKLPEYAKKTPPTAASLLLHNICLMDRYPLDQAYITLRDQLQAKLLEKMEAFSNQYDTFTDTYQVSELVDELNSFYPNRDEGLAVAKNKMSSEAYAALETAWPIRKKVSAAEWLKNNP